MHDPGHDHSSHDDTFDPFREGALPAAILERIFGRPAAQWTIDDIIGLVEERGIRLISLMHVGGDGWLKTLDFVPRTVEHLRDIIEGGERCDGSSVFAGKGIKSGASDILLRPRIETAFLDPFTPYPTLVFLCGHDGRDGHPLPASPDTIIRRAYQRARTEAGVDLWALGEVEFFLGKRKSEEDIYGHDDRGYHATSPFVFGEGLRREALVLLAGIGLPVKYGHSEVGYIEATDLDNTIWEQHEIELALTPLPQAADAVVVTEWVLRNLAHANGMRCSLDPIMRKGHAGSGLHFHFSPLVDGQHVGGRGPDGKLTDPSRWLIGGLTQLGGALMAFGNRTEGSFVRLTQGKEAPNTVVWGEFNRQALIRLPVTATTPAGRFVSPPTIEFRLPDGSAHPHWLLAGVAQALLLGRSLPDLEDVLERTSASTTRDQGTGGASVPRSFSEVAAALETHRATLEADGIFPTSLIDKMIETIGTR